MHKSHPESGFTIVEVLAASALLSIIVLCAVQGWAVVNRLSFDLLLRQKAIFVLNGEMERAVALYTRTNFGASVTSSSTGYTAYAAIVGSGTRITYSTAVAPVTFTVSTASAFTLASAPDSLVWMNGGGSGTPFNYVWLDRPRGLLARLSWSACTVTNATSKACWVIGSPAGQKSKSNAVCYGYGGGSGVCELITMFLDYPYVIAGGVPTPLVGGVASAGATPASTLSLSTIVGRRE